MPARGPVEHAIPRFIVAKLRRELRAPDNLLFLLEFIVADRRPGPAANAMNIDRSRTTQDAGCGFPAQGHCLPAASRTGKRKRPRRAVFLFQMSFN